MTYRSVEERWAQHKKDAYKRNLIENRPLYRAINKYGIQHFSIEQIEETNEPEIRERYWIEYYGSFKNGYNATIGGDGKPYIDYDLVVATYRELKSQKETAIKLNIHPDTVRYILKIKEEPVLSHLEVVQRAIGKVINQYDLDNNFIQSFPSVKAAAESLGKITLTSNGATSHISDVCRGKRKTAYGYKWKFADINNQAGQSGVAESL